MNKVSKRFAVLAALTGVVASSAFSASAALNLPTQNCSYTFTQNVKIGSKGAEVMNLQKVLNMFPQTMVASTGAGSIGMETTTFGPATKAAVIKFQNLHASDVLTPAGLTVGNGNVFSLTRAMLNQICGGTTTPTTPTGPVSAAPVNVTVGQVAVGTLVAGQSAAKLAEFTITGNGTVTGLELTRTGVSENRTLKNVYLFDGATRLTDSASVLSDGTIRFGASNGLFTLNGSKTITVRSDIDTLTGGQLVGVAMKSVTMMGATTSISVVAQGPNFNISSAVALTANFPTGNTTLPSATSINAGSINQTVWTRSLSVGTRAAKLHSFTVKMIGSAPTNSLANVTLYVDGMNAGSASVNSMNQFVFNMMSNPMLLSTGSHTLEVRADIVGGANRNFYIVLERAI